MQGLIERHRTFAGLDTLFLTAHLPAERGDTYAQPRLDGRLRPLCELPKRVFILSGCSVRSIQDPMGVPERHQRRERLLLVVP